MYTYFGISNAMTCRQNDCVTREGYIPVEVSGTKLPWDMEEKEPIQKWKCFWMIIRVFSVLGSFSAKYELWKGVTPEERKVLTVNCDYKRREKRSGRGRAHDPSPQNWMAKAVEREWDTRRGQLNPLTACGFGLGLPHPLGLGPLISKLNSWKAFLFPPLPPTPKKNSNIS